MDILQTVTRFFIVNESIVIVRVEATHRDQFRQYILQIGSRFFAGIASATRMERFAVGQPPEAILRPHFLKIRLGIGPQQR